MKNNYFLKVAAVLAGIMGSTGLSAQVTTFNYTGSLQSYTVPVGVDSIRIEVAGAQGGGGLHDVVGGFGAQIISNRYTLLRFASVAFAF